MSTLEHGIDYIWRQAKLARNCEEGEDFAITLHLLGLIRAGSSGGPGIFDLACGAAVGLCHAKYLRRRAERADFMRLELLRCIPDYDASTKKPMERDRTDGRRHYGNQFLKKHIKEHGWQGNGKPRDITPSIELIDSLCGSTEDLGKQPVGQIANSPTLNTNEDVWTNEAAMRKARLSAWSESARAKRKQRLAEAKKLLDSQQRLEDAKKLLDSVSAYLYGEVQSAHNAFERDSYTLALRLLAAVRRDDPHPLVSASYAAFGSSFPIYIQRRADRQWLIHQEFIRALPQEEATNGHKLLAMASSRVSRTDPRATSETNPPSAPARERVGDRATANRSELASVIPWPESPGVSDIADRRRPPKRIDSPAQQARRRRLAS